MIETATLAQLDVIFGLRGSNEVAQGSPAVVPKELMGGKLDRTLELPPSSSQPSEKYLSPGGDNSGHSTHRTLCIVPIALTVIT